MRIRNYLRNALYSLSTFFILGLFSLFLRKVILKNYSITVLGFEGLFSNLFSFMSLADMGIETVISYRPFSAITDKDSIKVNYLMSIYKKVCRIASLAILILGVFTSLFIKKLIKGNEYDWSFVYLVYYIQLLSVLSTYLLGYKRLIFIVNQNEAEITKVNFYCTCITNILKIMSIVLLNNYLLYLILNILNNIVINLCINNLSKKKYPSLETDEEIHYYELKNNGIIKDIAYGLPSKVSGIIYAGTDNIIISAFAGIQKVGFITNYNTVVTMVSAVMEKLLSPLQASISNYIYSEDKESGVSLFFMFDRICFFIASFISITFFCMFNPFITVWIGKEYLLPLSFVFAFSINQYILYIHKVLVFYRYSFGNYEIDTKYNFIAAIINVIISLLLVKKYDVTGVMIGTIIGHLGFWYGRFLLVHKIYIPSGNTMYIKRQLCNIVLVLFEGYITYRICDVIHLSYIGLCLKFVVCLLVPNIINLALFLPSKDGKMIVEYFKKTISVLANKK